MKIFQTAKKSLIASLLFFAQKTFAEGFTPQITTVAYGPMPVVTSFPGLFARLIAPAVIIIVIFLSGIFSPIIGYQWYIQHGGTKKWLKWLAYGPWFIIIAAIIAFIILVPQFNR